MTAVATTCRTSWSSASSDRYLNRASIYPRQATLLKCIFLQDELFTQYDYDILGEWADGFRLREADPDATTTRFEGDWGISPDVLSSGSRR